MTALLDLPVRERFTPSMALAPTVPPVGTVLVGTVPLVGAVPGLRVVAPSPSAAPAIEPATEPAQVPTPARAPARVRRVTVRGSGVGGCAVDPAAVGAIQAGPKLAPLRLTRRARLLVSTLTVVGALGLVGLAAAQADPGAGRLTDAPASVVVQPGDTLWQIALEVAPGERPAEVVELLQAANGLDGVSLQPGQVLTVPRS